MKRNKYCNSNVWSYEKETFPDDDPIYTLYYTDENIGTCPSWSFMKDVIKEGNTGKTIEKKIRLAKEKIEVWS